MEQEAASQSAESPLSPAGRALLQRAQARHQRLLSTKLTPAVTAFPWLPVGILTLIIVLADLALPPLAMFDDSQGYREWPSALGGVAMTAVIGLIPAQVILLGLMVACSPGPLWRRVLVLAGQLVLICAAVMLGEYFFLKLDGEPLTADAWREARILVCTLPVIALLCPLPFWFARLALGWEWTPIELKSPPAADDDAEDEVSYQQMPTMGQFLAGFTIACGCLGILLLTPPPEYSWDPPPFVAALLMAFLGCGLSLVVGLPLVMFFTRIKWRMIRWGVPVALVTFFAATAYLISYFDGSQLDASAYARFVAAQVLMFFSGGVGGIAMGLALYQWFGWTLRPVFGRIC